MDSSSPPDNENPYRSPADDTAHPQSAIFTPGSISNTFHRENLRHFRRYMHLLGGLLIGMGCLLLALLAFIGLSVEFESEERDVFLIVTGCVSALWLGLGVAVCCKQLWALYISLGLFYLSLLGNVLRCNLIVILILAAMLSVAHAALSRATQLRRAGIPLSMKPHELG
jgi:hypothetical protein